METWLVFRCDFDDTLGVRVPQFHGTAPTLKKAQEKAQAVTKAQDPNHFVEFLQSAPRMMHTIGVDFYYYLPKGYSANELSWRADGSGGEPTGAIWWIFCEKVGDEPVRKGGDDAARHY